MTFRAFLLTFYLLAGSGPGFGATVVLRDPVADHPGVTYLDLITQVFPDLDTAGRSASGEIAVDIRHITESDYAWEQRDPIEVGLIRTIPFRAEGEDRLLVLFDAGWSSWSPGELMLLAMFDTAAAPKLLDVVDVSIDQHTGFFDPPTIDLSADDQAVLVTNAHWNSNQSYVSTSMIFVRGKRLELIDDIFTFSDHSCAFENRQRLRVVTLPGIEPPYAEIKVSVLEEGSVIETDCGDEVPPAPYARVTEVTYRWDSAASGFLPSSDALQRLAAQSAERF